MVKKEKIQEIFDVRADYRPSEAYSNVGFRPCRQSGRVQGYIFENSDGAYLNRDFAWYNGHGYVHPETELDSIKSVSASWDIKPVLAYRASFDRARNELRITLDAIDFNTL